VRPLFPYILPAMKYFSIEDWKMWEPWDRIQENKKRYHEYIQTIRHKLPPDLRLLCDFSREWSRERIYLNDSQVSEITASFETLALAIILKGDYTNGGTRYVGVRRFSLNYKGVTRFEINAGMETAYNPGPDADPEEAPPYGVTPYGIVFDDHGWDEIELLEDGLFEHRMLFAGGTETVVRFRDFTLEYIDTPHAKATE